MNYQANVMTIWTFAWRVAAIASMVILPSSIGAAEPDRRTATQAVTLGRPVVPDTQWVSIDETIHGPLPLRDNRVQSIHQGSGCFRPNAVSATPAGCVLGDGPIQSALMQSGPIQSGSMQSGNAGNAADRIWLISTRNLPYDAACVNIPVRPKVWRMDRCGNRWPSSVDEYQQTIMGRHACVIYVHGNRYTASDAVESGMYVLANSRRGLDTPIDFVIWSWPSDRKGVLGYDVRIKAARTDAQGLMLADFLEFQADQSIPTTLIGFSFGGRVITGAMHAMAGGTLGGRFLPKDSITGADFDVGLIAPAVERNWLNYGGYHELASQNIHRMTVLYNRRDIVLKRYWLIDKVRGQIALGYAGPKAFAARVDGSPLPVRGRDCSQIVGLQHDETDYYEGRCDAGGEISLLIRDTMTRYRGTPDPPVIDAVAP